MPESSTRRGTRSASRAIDRYLLGQSDPMRAVLQKLRASLRAAAPGAEETISYRIPALRYRGKLLVWYAGFARHGSLFPGHIGGLPSLAREMEPYRAAKGTLHFTPDRPLPARLVRRIVRARIAQLDSASSEGGNPRARGRNRPARTVRHR